MLAPWSEGAAARLATIKGADRATLDNWRADIAKSRARLLDVRFDGSNVGFVIWSIMDATVVINAATIDPIKGRDMTETLFEFGKAMCERHGCPTLRFETYREGLRRKLQDKMRTKYIMEFDVW
jgi:hypothetical protein